MENQSAEKLGQTQAIETDEFASLLQKEFKPKTDQARDAVQNAVRTLAAEALKNTQSISGDAYITPSSRRSKARGAVCIIWSITPRPTNC